jgi:hypothetical protein
MREIEGHEQATSTPATQNLGPSPPMLMSPTLLDHVFDPESDTGLRQDNNDAPTNDPMLTGDVRTTEALLSENEIMQDVLGSTLALPDLGDLVDFDLDPVLDDMDFSFLNDTAVPPSQPSAVAIALSSTLVASPMSTATGVGAEAYQKSAVHRGWQPGRDENHELEHQDLVMPRNLHPEYLKSSREKHIMNQKSLTPSMRDRILAMILRTTSAEAADRAVASFPTYEILRDLIHLAFVRMRELQPISFIHVPSFNLNEQRPELLAALVAYGSIHSPSPSVRKFGHAIQETVRIAINQLVCVGEEFPSAVAKLS